MLLRAKIKGYSVQVIKETSLDKFNSKQGPKDLFNIRKTYIISV